MPEYKLAAENRSDAGKGAARRLRASGRVPAVLYGHGTKPQHLSVDARQFSQALRTDAGVNVLISLEVGSDQHLALAKEIQRHPVKGNLIHVDFIQVRRGEKVHVQVPVHLVGEAPGAREGGIVDQDLYQLNVEAEVTAVPEAVEADLKAPEGAVILDDAEASVVSVVAPTVEPEPEVEEAEEGEAAEGAEGAEAAASEAAGEDEDRPEA